MLTFQQWCEQHGNADGYQAYRFDSIADAWDTARRERRTRRGDIVSAARKRWLTTARSDPSAE